MGVTIHYRLGQRKEHVKAMLDRAQKFAEGIRDEQASKTATEFMVTRLHPYRLVVDIGNCESLNFGFGSWKHWEEKKQKDGYSYENGTLPDTFKKSNLEEESMMWCSAFCKTQYAESIVEHKWVADIVRMVAAYCAQADVYDEGGYYFTGNLEDAATAISENGRMIASLGEQLCGAFGADNVIQGGETKVKPTRKHHEK